MTGRIPAAWQRLTAVLASARGGSAKPDQADENEAAFQLLLLRQGVQPSIGDAEHAMAARGQPLACGGKVTACAVRERHRALILQPSVTEGQQAFDGAFTKGRETLVERKQGPRRPDHARKGRFACWQAGAPWSCACARNQTATQRRAGTSMPVRAARLAPPPQSAPIR